MTQSVYAIVAAEASGDILASGLVKSILSKDPNASFVGIYGPRVRELIGTKGQLFDMETLSVMGIAEVLKALPRILRIRKTVISEMKALKPIVYIGIDAPDFNIPVELELKKSGITTVHYVSPSVWAWRSSRIFKIKAATDMVLSLLPFEKDFYDKYDAPCTFVGHRLAREIPKDIPITAARMSLKFSESAMKSNQVVGVLPGSRLSEIKFLTPEFAEAAYKLQKTFPVMRFICAATTYEKAKLIKSLWSKHAPNIPLTIWVGKSRDVMAASNALMIASGTATLEAMLIKKPMVVCYIVSHLTAFIARRMLKVDTYSLPNLLAGKRIVPELIQEDCTPINIANEISNIFTSDDNSLIQKFRELHNKMAIDSDELACKAVFDTIYKKMSEREQALNKSNSTN